MEHVDYAYTRGMDEAAIEQRLQTTDTGVLALARDSEAYAIPLAHYYDGDRLFFRVGKTEHSEKWAFIETTTTANYVCYGTEPTDDPDELKSWSVQASGRLHELPPEDRDRFDTAEINEHFSPIRVFDEDIDDIEVTILELEIEELNGRTTL